MNDLELPQPTKIASSFEELIQVAVEFFPYGGATNRVYEAARKRYLERQLRKILDVVKNAGLDVLDDEQVQRFLPAAFIFSEKVKLGEYDHNLEILRRLIVEGLTSKSDVGKIGRYARQLEYLTEFEIEILAGIYEASERVGESAEKWLSGDYKRELVRFKDVAEAKIQEAMTALFSRGLLVITGSAWGTAENSYRLSSDAKAIVLSAVKE